MAEFKVGDIVDYCGVLPHGKATVIETGRDDPIYPIRIRHTKEGEFLTQLPYLRHSSPPKDKPCWVRHEDADGDPIRSPYFVQWNRDNWKILWAKPDREDSWFWDDATLIPIDHISLGLPEDPQKEEKIEAPKSQEPAYPSPKYNEPMVGDRVASLRVGSGTVHFDGDGPGFKKVLYDHHSLLTNVSSLLTNVSLNDLYYPSPPKDTSCWVRTITKPYEYLFVHWRRKKRAYEVQYPLAARGRLISSSRLVLIDAKCKGRDDPPVVDYDPGPKLKDLAEAERKIKALHENFEALEKEYDEEVEKNKRLQSQLEGSIDAGTTLRRMVDDLKVESIGKGKEISALLERLNNSSGRENSIITSQRDRIILLQEQLRAATPSITESLTDPGIDWGKCSKHNVPLIVSSGLGRPCCPLCVREQVNKGQILPEPREPKEKHTGRPRRKQLAVGLAALATGAAASVTYWWVLTGELLPW